MNSSNWTREETIIAFNVYFKIPFNRSSKTHPLIVEYSKIIGRSPSALNMKVGNIGRLDPNLKSQGISGLGHGARLEEQLWEEFDGNWDRLAYESELLIAKYKNRSIESQAIINEDELPLGKERDAIVKARVNQSFFRSMILSSYRSACCITRLTVPELLVASHIKPWSQDKVNRVNPHNGLCLNVMHDKAFDRGLITITPDYKVKVSGRLDNYLDDKSLDFFFYPYHNQTIDLPDRFLPSQDFLEYHNNQIYLE